VSGRTARPVLRSLTTKSGPPEMPRTLSSTFVAAPAPMPAYGSVAAMRLTPPFFGWASVARRRDCSDAYLPRLTYG
jgi:hypothetical protein